MIVYRPLPPGPAPGRARLRSPAPAPAMVLAMVLAAVLALSLPAAGPAAAQGHDHGAHGGHGAAAAPPAPSPEARPSPVYSTTGTVRELDPAGGRLVVEHGPIEAVGWGPMTMGFRVGDPALLGEVSVGDRVRLDIRFDSPEDYLVVDLERIE